MVSFSKQVTIKAETIAGEGMPYYTECDTNRQAVRPPSRPKFKFLVLYSDSGYARVKVTWQPQIEGNPGSHFYVQYKKDMETQFKSSEEELNQDSVVIGGLDPDYTYDFRVVAVDGDHETPSETIPIYTYPGALVPQGHKGLAHSGWFIGMMLAVVFLIVCCVVVCLIKRNRGGKYAVQESEERQGRRDPYDDGGFPEYTQP